MNETYILPYKNEAKEVIEDIKSYRVAHLHMCRGIEQRVEVLGDLSHFQLHEGRAIRLAAMLPLSQLIDHAESIKSFYTQTSP
jgi:hypothetical protein